MDDSTIIDMFLARNEDALKITANKYGKVIRSISCAILGDDFLAEECENDTYLSAWNLIPPNEPRDYFLSFLIKIAKHTALDICRKNQRKKRKCDIVSLTSEIENYLPAAENTHNELEAKMTAEAINSFLRALPKEQRIIFIRRYWYQDSIEEISERLDIGKSKVKVTLHRLRNQLKKYLEKEGLQYER